MVYPLHRQLGLIPINHLHRAILIRPRNEYISFLLELFERRGCGWPGLFDDLDAEATAAARFALDLGQKRGFVAYVVFVLLLGRQL